MEYLGYEASIEYCPIGNVYYGRVKVDELVDFHGKTYEETKAAFEEAVRCYMFWKQRNELDEIMPV